MLEFVNDPGIASREFIDLSCKCTGVLGEQQDKAWLGQHIDATSCVIELDKRCIDELHGIANSLEENPLPQLLRSPAQFNIPNLSGVMRKTRRELSDGIGVAVIDRLPLDELDETHAITIFWVLGQLIGRPVAQKWDGTMLYHVEDTGVPFGYGVRGSYTNIELTFHTDNAFGVATPETVGLLCLRPAMSGGISRFCSLYAVHNQLLREYPQALQRLYQPMLWDRQAEHAPEKPKFSYAPMFRYDGTSFLARTNTGLVRKAYERAKITMDTELGYALDCVDIITLQPGYCFELPLERGQMQYLNNREVAHYRSAFQDYPESERKRHLVRSWHRQSGMPTYDGG
jgi:hypothetical protein